jgi:hypothetical protein
MSLGIKKWFKKKPKKLSFENVICKNCETHFSGKYCPECGQSVKDYDQPFTFIFYNFAGDFFSFDTRFFRTFWALLIKPGFLSKEYFDGKRVKYAPPFRVFIFVSFVLFLLLQIYTNKGLNKVLDSSISENDKISLDSVSLAITDSLISGAAAEMDLSAEQKFDISVNQELFKDVRNLRQLLGILSSKLEDDLKVETDPGKQVELREYIRLCRSPEQAVTKILEYMSWAFFLLLPIFALILKLVFIRRKHNYMRHLIFSIHIHSFIFVVLILIIGFYQIFNGNMNSISAILMFSIPVYFIIAMKKFYRQNFKKVILKFFAVSFLYNTVFWTTVVIVFLNVLSIV